MAGTRQFDHNTVVDRAMLLFWRNGYGATSIDDLAHPLGLDELLAVGDGAADVGASARPVASTNTIMLPNLGSRSRGAAGMKRGTRHGRH